MAGWQMISLAANLNSVAMNYSSENQYKYTTKMNEVENATQNVHFNLENNTIADRRKVIDEELNKIKTITIATIENSRKNIDKLSKDFKKLNINTQDFWQEYPRIQQSNKISEILPEKINITNNLVQINNQQFSSILEHKKKVLKRKYFRLWKELVDLKKSHISFLPNKNEQKEKLNDFIKNLKTWKKENKVENKPDKKPITTKPLSCYKSRYSAQKTIIDMQRSKIEAQDKVIQELKLGIIREDLLKSIENNKTNIHELFADCTQKLKQTMPIYILDEHKFNINAQKAPKIVQQMEQRALERARNREIILERKRIAEEVRQKLLEEAIEKKRVLEEEERKNQLDLMKERRKKELEIEKVRQANKKRYLEGLDKAVRFHNNLLLKQCFFKLYKNMLDARNKNYIAREHYVKKMLRTYFDYWLTMYESIYAVKYEIADSHFGYTVMKKYMKIWREYHMDQIRNMQVAEDLYDLRLTSNMFIRWQRYVCNQSILMENKMKKAQKHYNKYRKIKIENKEYNYLSFRKLLFQSFYQWMSLKAVLELEKAKEKKKKKWREKVWEILPDYKPPEDF